MTIIETRGVWLTTTDSKVLRSQQRIAEAMDFLAETGFNVVFPVVWGRGATLYPSRVMRQTFGIEIEPLSAGRDPLAEIIAQAHRVNLKVIPWFEYGFASSYKMNGGELLAKKPEWAARDCHGNLLEKNGFEWLNSLNPEVQNFMLNLILEVVQNYQVDGIQGDDRLPALPCEGGYDRTTVERYRQQFGKNPPQNSKDPQWLQWRANLLTEFLASVYQSVKAVNPNLLISMTPNLPDWGYQEYLQDSRTWMGRGLVDMFHPQIYRRDFLSYKNELNKILNEQLFAQIRPKLTPGILMKIGSYCISPEHLLQAIKYNRACGIRGEVFFFYEGLRENNNALAKLLRKGPYAQSATFPSLADLNQASTPQIVSDSILQRGLRIFRNIF
ncbi:family 10 glycosylhydrolase [Chlorogloeopsis sp. ULAP01]|uniref:glycoside hydrolase family 10 protein n=1 Tax=Chlorogloeopsis sp. ULAP01 TaxID=3056483 RepID=UPI0025AAA029|nr:family 10 glycosylhydrolase [Chlorogloeopsis sp. ULAP01]MDM9380606.1 family 10 glycosylhydrolase [Chlorogloeopsis sp. ULAP01]